LAALSQFSTSNASTDELVGSVNDTLDTASSELASALGVATRHIPEGRFRDRLKDMRKRNDHGSRAAADAFTNARR
jgi:hypothetical protein